MKHKPHPNRYNDIERLLLILNIFSNVLWSLNELFETSDLLETSKWIFTKPMANTSVIIFIMSTSYKGINFLSTHSSSYLFFQKIKMNSDTRINFIKTDVQANFSTVSNDDLLPKPVSEEKSYHNAFIDSKKVLMRLV